MKKKISKPEKHNLSRNNAIKNEFDFIRKKKYLFIADSKLQNDQINRKSHYLFKNQIVLKVKTTISFQVIN